jgi:5-methylthioadenosine/S-adenosylhomocysteine deaminase
MSGAERGRRAGGDVTLSRREFATGMAACGLAGAFGFKSGAAFAQAPRESRYLFKNGIVLTMDPKVGDFDRADVLVEGRKIVAVRPDIQATATVINAANTIVMPGFIDTHHHFYQSALRNVLANGLLEDYFRDIVNKATPLYRAEDAHIGVLSGALRSLSAGITNVVDLSQVSNTPEHSDAMVKAFQESGIRAIYAYARGYGEGAIRRTWSASRSGIFLQTTSSSRWHSPPPSARTSGCSRASMGFASTPMSSAAFRRSRRPR